MVDSFGYNLAIDIKGERWVSYPSRIKFPRSFAVNYPFRGSGIASRVLYYLHKTGLDRLALNKVVQPAIASQFDFDVAFFWPSRIRSSSRFYGYGVKDGKVIEYIKFAIGAAERLILDKEYKNTIRACEITNHMFQVPEVLGVETFGDVFAVRYQPLPEEAHTCPLSDEWIARARDARRQIQAAGYIHGDFSWHNFKAAGEKLWIVDWEEMRKTENYLVDKICLECGLDYYWRHASIEKVMAAFCREYGRDARLRAKAGEAVEDLAQRKITMGDVLNKALKKEGWQ